MESIDVSDLAFSLANATTEANNIISSTSDKIADAIKEASIPIPEIDFSPIKEQITNVLPDSFKINNNIFIVIIAGIGIFIILSGIFLYNYYTTKNKKVSFNDNVEVYNYQKNSIPTQNTNKSEF
jgi:hypothetical protein